MVGPAGEHRHPSSRQPGVMPAAAVAVVATGLIAGLLLVGSPPGGPLGPSPVVTAAASPATVSPAPSGRPTQPGSSPAATAAPSASPEPGQWTAVALPPLPAVAELQPERSDAAGVAVDSAFTLTSTGGDDPAALAARLTATPAVEFAVAAGPTAASVTVRPRTPLVAGQVYRFALSAPDSSLAGSWVFQARSPLHVVTTLPGNQTTGVPTRTGIEVTFDQDGAGSIEPFFSIEPAAAGRFEQHGRTQVFVPDELQTATLYTVTVRRGVPRTGSDVRLERDVRFEFETAGDEQPREPRVSVDRTVLESSPGSRPIVGVTIELQYTEDGELSPNQLTSVPVSVYRFPSLASAVRNLRLLLSAPGWTEFTSAGVPTAGLARALHFTGRLRSLPYTDEGRTITFPSRLPRGWYLVEVGQERPAQAFLQVTEVSAWVSVLTDRTVVWANDTVTGRPIVGAGVRVHGGDAIGRTGRDGLMIEATPQALIPAAATSEGASDEAPAPVPILTVRAPDGHQVLIPLGIDGEVDVYRGEWWKSEWSGDERWWSILATDRSLYRQSDRINAWGLLRRRADGATPETVELRLVRTQNEELGAAPVIASTTVQPGRTGAFAGTLVLKDADIDSYYIEALVGGRVVARHWLSVEVIRKPLFRLSASTAPRVVARGESVKITSDARFFDGQPVPGVALTVASECEDPEATCPTVTTDAAGRVTIERSPGTMDEDQEDPWDEWFSIGASAGEEGSIEANTTVLVFPSAVHLAARGSVVGSRLVVSGSARAVDFTRIERELAAGTYKGDPAGAALAGQAISARITELIPVRRLVRRDYDYIEKRVVPVYEYSVRRKLVTTRALVTGADGAFAFRLAIPNAEHEYEVLLTTKDAAGRTQLRTVYSGEEPVEEYVDPWPSFRVADRDGAYSIGQTVRMTVVSRGKVAPSGGPNRYLYVVAQGGLRSAYVTASPRFVRRFGAADAPGVFVMGVRFTGSTYAPKAAAWASFDPADRALTVAIAADKAGYRPGETVDLTVRTTDARGRPVPASVTLRAVDEKLFAMGAADEVRPLAELYSRVTSGILRLTATHQVPVYNPGEGEGGGAGGGGGDSGERRDDFRDSVLFRQVETDATGTARVSFGLSDDLTAWHVSATAVTAKLQAGEGQLLVPVSLPFFVEATIADGYLADDRPVIGVRTFGSALTAGDPVVVTVSAPSLGLQPTRVTGRAFETVGVQLPSLTAGEHSISIEGTVPSRTGSDGQPFVDRLQRTIRVVDTRLQSARTSYLALATGTGLPGGDGLTTYTFSDAGRGAFVPLLEELASGGGLRLDRAVAQAEAGQILVAEYGRDPASLPPAVDLSQYEIVVPDPESAEEEGIEPGTAGIPLLPYGGPDPALAARVALAAPDLFGGWDLRAALRYTRDRPETTRDLRLLAIAGLAALGEPVLDEVRTAVADIHLTVRERIYVALAAQAAGDDATAVAIERDLLQRYGQQLGGQVRLKFGATLDSIAVDTSLLALVAAGTGDPVASSLFAYVEANPAVDELHVLEEVGYVRRALPRTPAAAASFAWTLAGQRQVVQLAAGESRSLGLTAVQRTAVRLEPLTGRVAVAASWLAPVAASGLRPDPDLQLERRVIPAGAIPFGTLVEVVFRPTFGRQAAGDCYEVVDLAPSGLAPISWPGFDRDESSDPWLLEPYSIAGQRVAFCVPAEPGRNYHLHYRARVVTAGDYRWEAALMQLAGAPEALAMVPATRVTIAGR